MNNKTDYDTQTKKFHAHEIELIESTFLAKNQRYLNHQIPFKNLVAFCVETLLNHQAAQFINQEMYCVMADIAISQAENAATIVRLENVLKQKKLGASYLAINPPVKTYPTSQPLDELLVMP